MLQRDVRYRPKFWWAGYGRHHDFSIADRKHSRSILPEIQSDSNHSEYTRLRHQGDFHLRIRRLEEAEKARTTVQQPHVSKRSVVRRFDVFGATGFVVQFHRVNRTHGLREIATSQMARRQGEPFDVPGTDPTCADGRPREAPFLRKSSHLAMPRHGKRIAFFSFEKTPSFERAS